MGFSEANSQESYCKMQPTRRFWLAALAQFPRVWAERSVPLRLRKEIQEVLRRGDGELSACADVEARSGWQSLVSRTRMSTRSCFGYGVQVFWQCQQTC